MELDHRCVRLKQQFLREHHYKVILLGFLEGYDRPDDVLRWAEAQGYGMAEHRETMHEHEKGIDLEYRLVVAAPAFVAD